LIIGTDPEQENELTGLKDRLVEGDYFEANGKHILMAEGAAKAMDVGVGDTLILISQGYHGVNAAGKYPISGLVFFPSPDMNKRMVFMPLKAAQYFFGAENLVTSIGLKIENRKLVPEVFSNISTSIDLSEYELMDWKELIPELVQARQADLGGGYMMLAVLYIVITFGIFGTILMMMKEREYEFGILIAIGMKRRVLAMLTWLEIVLLGLIGSLIGILGSIPFVYYLSRNPINMSGANNEMAGTFEKWGMAPIFQANFEFAIFFNQALIVFILTSFLAIYTLLKVMTLKPVAAMRIM